MLVLEARHFAREPGIAKLAEDAVEAGIIRCALGSDVGRELGEQCAAFWSETKSVPLLLETGLGGRAYFRRSLVGVGDGLELKLRGGGPKYVHQDGNPSGCFREVFGAIEFPNPV